MEKLFDIILQSNQERKQKAKLIAEKIRDAKGYSWIGLYDVTKKDIHLISYAGRSEPTFISFPNDKGLNGRANLEKRTVIVNDIDRDEDYLLTFSDTQSEIVVPVFDTDEKPLKAPLMLKVNKRMHLIRKTQLSWKDVRSQFNRFGTTNNNK